MTGMYTSGKDIVRKSGRIIRIFIVQLASISPLSTSRQYRFSFKELSSHFVVIVRCGGMNSDQHYKWVFVVLCQLSNLTAPPNAIEQCMGSLFRSFWNQCPLIPRYEQGRRSPRFFWPPSCRYQRSQPGGEAGTQGNLRSKTGFQSNLWILCKVSK